MGDGGSSAYWNIGNGRHFDLDVQWHFNDLKSARYYDGALNGFANTLASLDEGIISPPDNINLTNNLSSQDRFNEGKVQGERDAAEIIKSLARTGGVITESIKVVTHSMGAAYGKGLIEAIIKYAKAHPKECNGLSITEYDFAAFQQNHLSAIPGVPLFQFDNIGDNVVDGKLGRLNGSRHAKQKGREEKGSNSNVNPEGGHSIGDYASAINSLEEGTYKFVNGKFVKQ